MSDSFLLFFSFVASIPCCETVSTALRKGRTTSTGPTLPLEMLLISFHHSPRWLHMGTGYVRIEIRNTPWLAPYAFAFHFIFLAISVATALLNSLPTVFWTPTGLHPLAVAISILIFSGFGMKATLTCFHPGIPIPACHRCFISPASLSSTFWSLRIFAIILHVMPSGRFGVHCLYDFVPLLCPSSLS